MAPAAHHIARTTHPRVGACTGSSRCTARQRSECGGRGPVVRASERSTAAPAPAHGSPRQPTAGLKRARHPGARGCR
eukprot:5033758-Prymnesium_polylepis.1